MRYNRQTILRGFGAEAQQKLASSSVIVVGAGGLGCPLLQYLAGAGLGTIAVVDHDRVSLSDLHRQVLYTTEDIGLDKVTCAESRLQKINPEITIETYNFKLDNSNAISLFTRYDIVVDATDNFQSRYIINDACILLAKPLVYAGIFEYEGQVAVFNVRDNNGVSTNYRDLFPVSPDAADAPDCNTSGVLGMLTGIIGCLQASEVIKLVTGIGVPLINTLLNYNLLDGTTYEIALQPREEASVTIPATLEAFLNYNYQEFCGVPTEVQQIESEMFERLRLDEEILIIDVREPHEMPKLEFAHVNIPLSEFIQQPPNPKQKKARAVLPIRHPQSAGCANTAALAPRQGDLFIGRWS